MKFNGQMNQFMHIMDLRITTMEFTQHQWDVATEEQSGVVVNVHKTNALVGNQLVLGEQMDAQEVDQTLTLGMFTIIKDGVEQNVYLKYYLSQIKFNDFKF